MPSRETPLGGAAFEETLSGPARPQSGTRVGRETSPYVPRQPAPLPEAKQAEAERTFEVLTPEVVPYVPPDGGAPDGGGDAGGPGDAGDAGAGDAGNAGDPGAGDTGGGPF